MHSHGQAPAAPQPLPGVSNIIAVGSGKGGVGKTTLSVNLALALSKMGHKVGLLDADVYGPNVPLMLGTNAQPRAVSNERIEPILAQGLKVISVGFLNPGDKPIIWRGPMLHQIIRQFLGSVEWGELDYLVIDLPPGTGDVASPDSAVDRRSRGLDAFRRVVAGRTQGDRNVPPDEGRPDRYGREHELLCMPALPA
jgi:ATP-binding protein involved in chromosome partitioning